jgi:hypothetical protein
MGLAFNYLYSVCLSCTHTHIALGLYTAGEFKTDRSSFFREIKTSTCKKIFSVDISTYTYIHFCGLSTPKGEAGAKSVPVQYLLG